MLAFLLAFWLPAAAMTDASCKQYSPLSLEESLIVQKGCAGDACPDLRCRDFGFLAYANVDGADLRGSVFGGFGYAIDLSKIRNSDLRGAVFEQVTIADLSGSDLRDAVIEKIQSFSPGAVVDFRNTNLCGATINSIDIVDNVLLDGARFDANSKLPFDVDRALAKGMVYQE